MGEAEINESERSSLNKSRQNHLSHSWSELDPDDWEGLARHWYEAALYFLDVGDFMSQCDIRVVQSIAILGICFSNFGDHNLYHTMWACAIQVARQLGMNATENKTPSLGLSRRASHRLWWTLVICDWLVPCVAR